MVRRRIALPVSAAGMRHSGARGCIGTVPTSAGPGLRHTGVRLSWTDDAMRTVAPRAGRGTARVDRLDRLDRIATITSLRSHHSARVARESRKVRTSGA